MKNQIRYLISSVIAVYLMFGLYTSVSIADTTVIDDNDGWSLRIGKNTTQPGGFSAVAEPAGPVDPEAAKRAAEEYAQNT